jgi:tetratricopeptide (TPR) repeat protein
MPPPPPPIVAAGERPAPPPPIVAPPKPPVPTPPPPPRAPAATPAPPSGGVDRLAAQFLREGDEAFARARYADALRAYRKASWRSPQLPSAFYKIGLAYLMLTDYAKAAQAFDYVLTLDPGHAAARASLEAARRMLPQ